jgi:hypothetical protein
MLATILIQGQAVARPALAPIWILYNGFWNDPNVWIDSAYWID